jgi:hypothetical protein
VPPGQARHRGFDLALLGLSLGVVVASAAALPFSRVRVVPTSVLPTFGPWLLLPVLLAIYARRPGGERLADVIRMVMWGTLFSNIYTVPMYLLAARAVPLRDAGLAALDRALGLEVPAVLAWAARHPVARGLLDAAYASLMPYSLLALMLPPMAGQARRSREFLVAIVVACALTLGIFAWLQAIGPWAHYHLPASAAQRACARAIAALKSGGPVALDLTSPAPLIAFPSWHAILALLCTAALARLRYVGWLAPVWGGAIVVSTVTTGWHYLVDVLAGALVAALSQRVAGVLLRREDRAPGPSHRGTASTEAS